ncbi:transposase [Marinimicrobium alkaliphilum]|uniref:transposase n=1 Tax=Marinimicrobium alkaliphilum TaxID=2202654 RepID=UPI000DBAB3C8|nr:transposase [Marinimicrobium alkaliphilum]
MPRTLSKEYDSYTNEFKRLAVALSHHPDIQALEVADRLAIHPVMLYRWRMEMKNGDIPGEPEIEDPRVETDLIRANQEIRRLKKDLLETQRERDFLKKAKRFFRLPKDKSSRS